LRQHDGERAVQRRAGVLKELGSARTGSIITPAAATFLGEQPFIIVGAEADDVWATMLVGPPGFVRALDERTAVIDAVPRPQDPLHGQFSAEQEISILAIELPTRRRLRVNGRARAVGDRLVVRTDQVFGNCPKYIQQRVMISAAGPAVEDHETYAGSALTSRQQDWLAGTDTFFIATAATGLGLDASHRGGSPGFVRVLTDRRLSWPDYVGNSMYMTLGNLELNPAAGLLLIDWDRGNSLQLTGRAEVDWDPARAATMPGAQRVIDYEIDRVIQVDAASPQRWRLVSTSPFNP
jgi:predicted pyridoxine 5'-phosphate oxidase superfamily flavin-nucleotide-binding protein